MNASTSSSIPRRTRSSSSGTLRTAATFAAGAALLPACGGVPAPAVTGSLPRATPKSEVESALGPSVCPKDFDAAAFFARHAKLWGTRAAIDASFPKVFRYEVTSGGAKGATEVAVGKDTFRYELAVAGIHLASGRTGTGTWDLGLPGLTVDLKSDEGVLAAYREWTFRRGWVGDFDAKRDRVDCLDEKPAHVVVRIRRPEVGNPVLQFDLATAKLEKVGSLGSLPEGVRALRELAEWGPPDARGVRWPKVILDGGTPPMIHSLRDSAEGLACKGVVPGAGADGCTEKLPGAMRFEWPASGVVRAPLRRTLGQLQIRVKVGERETWALLGSGATVFVVDAASPLKDAAKPSMPLSAANESSLVEVGMGELAKVTIGGLTIHRPPTAVAPLTALQSFGDPRPEIVLGASLFVGAAVRVDTVKNEVVIAKDAAAIVGAGATAVPFRLDAWSFVVDASLDGVKAPLGVSTANAGVTMFRPWGETNGLPGKRPQLVATAQLPDGSKKSIPVMFRADAVDLGPIRAKSVTVDVDEVANDTPVAGYLGPSFVSQCRAFTIDTPKRTIWFEGPCDRTSPASLAGWNLLREDDAAWKGRPWVVASVLPESSAAEAGLVPGDRILAIGGVPAASDADAVRAATAKPEGTKVVVDYVRAGKKAKTTLTLHDVFGATKSP
ncbi:MAG: PDZ domain-containing protein [Polyangiaceae bacterium]